MARATGANGFVIETPQDLLDINVQELISQQRPTVLDVRIDPEEVPPIDVRMKVLLD
jgi:acetolactate synthase-1/2/3 large subunit